MTPPAPVLWLGADLGHSTGDAADASAAALVDVALAAVHEDRGVHRCDRSLTVAAPSRAARVSKRSHHPRTRIPRTEILA